MPDWSRNWHKYILRIITLSVVSDLFLKLYIYFLSNSQKKIFKFTNIPLVLLQLGKPNSPRKLLLYATFKFFIEVLVESYQNVAQCKLQQYVSNK